MNYDDEVRLKTYGPNIGVPLLVGLLKRTPLLRNLTTIPGVDYVAGAAHPYAASFYYGLNSLGRYHGDNPLGKFSRKVRESLFSKLTQAGGALYFGGASLIDALSVTKGDIGSVPNLVFNTLMTYQLGRDIVGSYRNL